MRLVNGTIVCPTDGIDERDLQVGGPVPAGSAGPVDEVIDVAGKLVIPGLVNLHDHLRSFMPGSRASEGMALPELLRHSWATSQVAEPSDFRTLSALGAARMVMAGVTHAVDHIYPLHRDGAAQAAIEGHQSVGLGVSLAIGMITRMPPELSQDPRDTFRLVEELADSALPADRLFVAPVSLRQTSVDAYRDAVDFADSRGLRLHTHIAESTDEVEGCVAEHGLRPVELLHSIGFLRPGTVLVHCVHLTDHELDLIADSGTAVAYCPSNHLRLAKGFAPVTAMLERGIPVGLGIDGQQDSFQEMRMAMHSQGTAKGDPGALDTLTAFRMATSMAARAAGTTGGDLAGGAPGDVATISTSRPHVQPVVDPIHTIVNRVEGPDVADVFVDGRPVVRDAALVRVDERDIVARAYETTQRLADRAGLSDRVEWHWGDHIQTSLPPPTTEVGRHAQGGTQP